MNNQHGDFIWYELMTTDADAAQSFYGELLGWTFKASEQTDDMDYRLFSTNGVEIGGLMPITEDMKKEGAQPLWAGYIGVDDVDASVKTITEKGGHVLIPPQDIPNVGRFSFLQDPQGAPFYVMSSSSDEASESFSTHAPRDGHCAWNELASSDPEGAKVFYGGAFGWVKADSMDMGPIGEYEMLKNGADRDFIFGALMKKPDEMPVSLWSYYFRVPSMDNAVAFIKSHAGQIVNGPVEIPGGEFALNAVDPQGAYFALVGKS